MKRPAFAALVAINMALALALAVMWITPQGRLRNVHWTAPGPVQPDYQQMLPALPQPEPVRTDAFLALLERPLFSSTRRPPPPPPPPKTSEPPADPLTDAQLLGIYQSGETSGVIARIDGKNRRIRLSESLLGWQLQSVQERKAVFVSGGQTRELPLMRAKIGSGGAANLPPPAAAIPPQAPPPQATPPVEPAAQTNPGQPAAPRRSRFSSGF